MSAPATDPTDAIQEVMGWSLWHERSKWPDPDVPPPAELLDFDANAVVYAIDEATRDDFVAMLMRLQGGGGDRAAHVAWCAVAFQMFCAGAVFGRARSVEEAGR